MKASVPKRFLTLREKDKDGTHRRSKSADKDKEKEKEKVRPLSSEAFFSIFKREGGSSKDASKEDDEKTKEAVKVEEISRRLMEQHYGHISKEHIRLVLASKYADGNVDKAIEALILHDQSFAGVLLPYNPNIHMLGAENREMVTCYLDSLLFAMFAKLDAFECMLKNDLPEQPQKKLAALLRLWVNMLRTGKLIQTDVTELLQNALADAGWRDARELEQQDTSEAFAFITETLQLPLLTLQVDLFHQGKGDVDDHKVVYERLLNLAVPPDPTGKGIKLEDCLEDYFNTKVDVLRDSLDEKKGSADMSAPQTPIGERTTIRVVTDTESQAGPSTGPVEDSPHAIMKRRWTVQSPEGSEDMLLTPTRPGTRQRATSIIQRIEFVDEKAEEKTEAGEQQPNFLQKARRTSSTVVKAVTIPAWQFFRLIPWHSASDKEPSNDLEVAKQLSQRPVLGICLKRYMWTESGQPQRMNTFIDIPDSMRLPHFMMVDDKKVEESEGISTEYKLVLQSVVCHRGDSLHSGHYISFARVAPKLLTDNRRHDFDPPPDYEDAQWVKFDDLHTDSRISYVDDIREALREEMPYLLLYQIVPMVDVTAASSTGSEPPAYTDSVTDKIGSAPTPSLAPSLDDWQDISRTTSGYFDASGNPSIRFSSEYERPSRLSLDEERTSARRLLATADNSRRGSLTFLDASPGTTPVITPEPGPSPSIPGSGEAVSAAEQNATRTAERLSRAAARFTKVGSRSRPASQSGEGRITAASVRSMLGFVKSSKEPLREDSRVSEAGQATTAAAATGLGLVGESTDALTEEPVVVGEEREGHHHHHLHHRKDRSRARRSGLGLSDRISGDKDKGKEAEYTKDGEKLEIKGDVPDRECVLM
jgi:hypothetical protein